MNGVEVTRRIRQAHPRLPILILTMLDDNTVFTALKAGQTAIPQRRRGR